MYMKEGKGGKQMSLMSLTAVELGRKIKEKEVTVEEAVTAALDAIEKRGGRGAQLCDGGQRGRLKACKGSAGED